MTVAQGGDHHGTNLITGHEHGRSDRRNYCQSRRCEFRGPLRCVACDGTAVVERPERTAQCYRRFRCRECGKQFNERSGGILNCTQYPSDVIAFVVFWRLRYKLSLRDLPEMFLLRGIEFTPPTDPMDGRTLASRQRPPNARDVYWLPRSE
jgi:hypothetical protein